MITKENVKVLLPIIKAYSEGKKIQFFNDREWVDREILSFDSEPHKYRIKSEYRPFKSVEECWEEMQKHQPFGWVKYKNENNYGQITYLHDNTEFINLFKMRVFTDGTPFGIKEEE